jgi:hypothetical protein
VRVGTDPVPWIGLIYGFRPVVRQSVFVQNTASGFWPGRLDAIVAQMGRNVASTDAIELIVVNEHGERVSRPGSQ